jgi:4-hydroxy-2-oxoheptanedioate aldolase
MATHSLLSMFKAGKPAFGAWLTTPGIFHARTVAQASSHLAWVVADCEHGLVPLVPGAAESIIAIHGAVPSGAPSAIVRIPATGVSQESEYKLADQIRFRCRSSGYLGAYGSACNSIS